MSRDSRVAILTLAIALPASWLWAQQPGLPVTLDQLQDVLKRLQGEVKSLQDTVKQRAEVLYRIRGNRPGSAIDDWLMAEEQIRHEIEEEAVDEASEDSFPASDPPSH